MDMKEYIESIVNEQLKEGQLIAITKKEYEELLIIKGKYEELKNMPAVLPVIQNDWPVNTEKGPYYEYTTITCGNEVKANGI